MMKCEEDRFRAAYLNNRPRLLHCLAHWTGDANEAADLMQEAFLRMYEKRIEPHSANRWLMKTSYRLFVDQWRKKQKTVWISLDEMPELPSKTSPSPEKAVIRSEFVRAVNRALAELPARDRTVLLKLAHGGTTYREIAEDMGCSEGLVKTVVHRARKRMRRMLETDVTGE